MTDKSLVDKVLGDPSKYPSALTSWIQRIVSGNQLIQIGTNQLPDAETIRLFGSVGNPSYEGTWANLGSGDRTGGFYKLSDGRIFLMGTIGGGSLGTAIVALPSGYIPEMKERFAVLTSSGIGEVDIDASGNVTHISGGTTWVSLAGISFRAG